MCRPTTLKTDLRGPYKYQMDRDPALALFKYSENPVKRNDIKPLPRYEPTLQFYLQRFHTSSLRYPAKVPITV